MKEFEFSAGDRVKIISEGVVEDVTDDYAWVTIPRLEGNPSITSLKVHVSHLEKGERGAEVWVSPINDMYFRNCAGVWHKMKSDGNFHVFDSLNDDYFDKRSNEDSLKKVWDEHGL